MVIVTSWPDGQQQLSWTPTSHSFLRVSPAQGERNVAQTQQSSPQMPGQSKGETCAQERLGKLIQANQSPPQPSPATSTACSSAVIWEPPWALHVTELTQVHKLSASMIPLPFPSTLSPACPLDSLSAHCSKPTASPGLLPTSLHVHHFFIPSSYWEYYRCIAHKHCLLRMPKAPLTSPPAHSSSWLLMLWFIYNLHSHKCKEFILGSTLYEICPISLSLITTTSLTWLKWLPLHVSVWSIGSYHLSLRL